MVYPISVRPLLVLTVLFVLYSSASAQYGSSIQGTVQDKSGAAVVGAKVTVTNEATGVNRDAVTSDSGFYRIASLTPGAYKVEVEATSFKKQTTPDVEVAAEATKGLDITVQPGPSQESVTVTDSAEGLQTENASVIGTITSQQLTNLPEFGRDPYELLRLTPGIFADSSRQGNGNSLGIPQQVGPGGSNNSIFQTENQVQAIANGQRVSANNFMLDGVSVNSLEWGGAAVITPNLESVQEISVSPNSYSAQDGRNSGAQVKVISKNGTNSLHGSALVKFNDKGLNAFNKFYGPTDIPVHSIPCEGGQFTIIASHCPDRDDQHYRDYAGSIGGPIIRNKLFFFFSYEGTRLRNTVLDRDVILETPEFEQYVISANPGSIASQIFSTPGIAPRISSVGSETDCCSLIPGYGLGRWYSPGNAIGQAVGNGPDGIPDWGSFDLTVPNSTSANQYNGRVDYTQGNNQFFASTYIVRLNNFNGGQRPIQDISLKPENYASTLGWTRTISGTMLNELRANFTRYNFDQTNPADQTNYGIPQIRLFDFDIAGPVPGAPGFGSNDGLLGIEQNSTTPGNLAQNTYGLAETFSWVHHQHAWKFGVEARREQNNNDQPGLERPQYQFRGLLNLANDACCFFEQVQVDPTGGAVNGQRYFHTNDYALFAQDDWKIRPNLTINLGLRWEYFTPLTEANNTLSNYTPGSQGIINGSVCGPVVPLTECPTGGKLYQSDKNNFGPRVGFAWSPGVFQSKVVFRGGFGVVFNRNADVVYDNIRENTPYSAFVSACCFFDPGPVVGPPPGSNIGYAIGSSNRATSYPVNPAFALGIAPDGALCADPTCATVNKVSLFGALPQEPNPYVYIFSYQVQLEPTKDVVLTMGYQGSRSRKLVRTIDLNRLIPGDTFDGTQDKFQNSGSDGLPCGPTNSTCLAPHATGNNRFGNLYFPLPDVNASYDAAVFTATRRFNHGLQINANYSWSHAIDTASFEVGYQQTDPINQLINRGNSDFDVRHNFVLSAEWEIQAFRGRRDFKGAVLGGWRISGIMGKHSGFPFSALVGNCDTNNDRNGDSYCPDMPFAYHGGAIANPSKQQWINGIFPSPATEFDITTRGPGCSCRNIFTGPGFTTVDMTLGKDFSLFREGTKLAIRANFFNVFNILQLSPLIPATSPTDITNTADFGRPSDGLAGRVIEFQARLSF